jgi:Skp family chaperone for outer membrane proteins
MRALFHKGSQFSQMLLVALATVLAVMVWEAVSQDRLAADAQHRIPVALMDVARVFKNCREFQQKMDRIKAEIAEYDRAIRTRKAEFDQLLPKNTGSAPPSGEAAEKAAKLQADLTAEMAAKRQAFLAAEAGAYAEVYAQIEKVTDQICHARDVGVVLRFNSDPLDPADRNSVLQGVNRAVIYSAVPDLTDDVLAALNGQKR